MNITMPNLYDSDYQLWLESTINQLRQGDFQAVLKLTYWQSQRDYNQAGWKKEIRNFRLQIADLLEDSPSLKSYLREILAKCYLDARHLMIDETRLDASIFPVEVLASLEEILDENWLPDWGAINLPKQTKESRLDLL
ncbi:MAG: DUF29 domain-containing protein [Microcystis aeruginosa LG13-11]|nr:DUF29 domain-containing protein [Microcystis aeruginosa LG13-11]